jgi:hypothetical protein
MRSFLAGSIAVLLLTGVACSDSSGDTESGETTTTSIRVLAADEVDGSRSPYCAVWKRLRAVVAPVIIGDTQKDTETRKSYYADLVPLAQELVDEADGEIEADARKALAQVQEVASTGSEVPFTTPDAKALTKRLADYALENCAK